MIRKNPKVGGVELYDPREEQIRAMRQGVYEGFVRKALGVSYKEPFRDSRGRRLDSKSFFPEEFRRAFATSTSVGQRHGFLEYGSQRGTERSWDGSAKRYSDVDHLLRNRQDYEETLGMYRKSGFYRMTAEPTKIGQKFFVWPMPPGEDDEPIAFLPRDREAAFEYLDYVNQNLDPRVTRQWWTSPKKRYTQDQLSYWLPPHSVFE
jgi:hypothetical protein